MNDVRLIGPAAEAVDRACEIDRLYFEAHPAASVYQRAAIPMEFAPLLDDEAWLYATGRPPRGIGYFGVVEVTQRAPGVRLRTPLAVLYGPEDEVPRPGQALETEEDWEH